jgi:hypothetical protein
MAAAAAKIPAALAWAFLAACTPTPHKPDFRALAFHPASDPQVFEAQALGRTVQVMAPDDVFHPNSWQGPLRIAGVCTANVLQVTAVYASRDVDYLLVITHTGAERFARFVDLRTCREVWPPLKAEIPIQVTGDAISIVAGQWLRLFAEHPPIQ